MSGLNFTVSFGSYNVVQYDKFIALDTLYLYKLDYTIYSRELDLFDVDIKWNDPSELIDHVIDSLYLSHKNSIDWSDLIELVNDSEALTAMIEYRVKYWFKVNGIPQCLVNKTDDVDMSLIISVNHPE